MSDLIRREDATKAVYDLSDKLANEMLFVDAVIDTLENLPSAEPERTAKVTLLNTGLHSVWGTCDCGRQVEKPGRNDQSGAYYCPRCGAKLEWK